MQGSEFIQQPQLIQVGLMQYTCRYNTRQIHSTFQHLYDTKLLDENFSNVKINQFIIYNVDNSLK